jgi:nickel/cobalt transporter (NicO) family protein
MVQTIPLLLGAVLVGTLHMSAPDHWVTLSLLGKIGRWSRARLMLVSLVTGLGHVLLSVALGLAIVEVGVLFTESLSTQIAFGTGVLMLVVGLAYGARQLLSNKPEDYKKEAESKLLKAGGSGGRKVGYFAVLGAALSPDLSILPIFILALPVGFGLAIDTAVVFGSASILTLLILVALGSWGLDRVFEKVPPKYNDALVGFVVAAVGAYIVIYG